MNFTKHLRLSPIMIFLLAFSLLISCSADQDVILEAVLEEPEITEEFIPENALTDCDFDLSNLGSTSTLTLDCNLDLDGNTIVLPDNFILEYQGGSISNGTLVFNGGQIDGRLLNFTLDIDGSVTLISSTFTFDKEKWGMVEGNITDQVAINNLNNINKAITLVKRLQGEIFEIDNIDAFFSVAHLDDRRDLGQSIVIPSNFHFKMGTNCILRVQPNGKDGYVLIYPERSAENITISGGTLIGDRYTHDYSAPLQYDWGHLMMFRGVHNSTVDGVEMREGMGEGFQVGGISHRNNDGSLKPNGRESYNITVKNCIFDDNRRNNISVVDGTNIFIEYNLIKNAGSGDVQKENSSENGSNGTSPRAGIDIEGFKNNAPDNNSVYDWEKTEEIHIRYNTFENNYAADVVFYNGENAYAYGNTFSGAVSTSYGFNNKIYDNTFISGGGNGNDGNSAIVLEPKYQWANGIERTADYEVYNNTIQGYKFGIVLGGTGHNVYDNQLVNNERGVILLKSDGIVYNNNNISSSLEGSYGYYTFSNENLIENTIIENGQVNVDYLGLYFSNKNLNDKGSLSIQNVDFDDVISFRNAHNITVRDSQYEEIRITDCEVVLINNTLK